MFAMTWRAPTCTWLAACAFALAACADRPSVEEGDETSESEGGAGDCVDNGSVLLDSARPAPPPNPRGNPAFSCTSGWGTDAPTREAEWTVRVEDEANTEFWQTALFVEALADAGAVVYGSGLAAAYDGEGEELWTMSLPVEAVVQALAEPSGSVLIGIYDYNAPSAPFSLTRYEGATGELIEPVQIAWNEPEYGQVWAMETLGDNLVLGAYDADSMGQFEETLLYVDRDGNELLRRSTSLFGGLALAVTEGGVALFGASPGFLVSLDDGAVLGQLTPSAGFSFNFVGMGDRFYAALGANNDLSMGAYSSVGTEQWLQGYDRATLFENANRIDARDGVIVVAGSTSLLNFNKVEWYSSQPLVLAADSEGNALWRDLIDARGDAIDVAIGGDGIYVSGVAEEAENTSELPPLRWLRKYPL